MFCPPVRTIAASLQRAAGICAQRKTVCPRRPQHRFDSSGPV